MTLLRYEYKTQPYAHQKRALAKIAKLDGKAGLFLPMRTGKSRIAVDWASIAYYNFGLRRVLIVCPIHVIDVWAEEIQKHSPVPNGAITISTLRGTAYRNAKAVKEWVEHLDPDDYVLHFVIVNYEMVWRKVIENGPRGGQKEVRLDEYLAQWKPDLIVADEAHKLKAPTSQQSKALGRLGAVARMKLALTGTPIAKDPLDLFGQFRFTDADTFEQKSWGDFKEHYAEWEPARYEPRIQIVKHYRNMDELVERTRAHSFRISLEEAFPDMPAKVPTNVKVELPPSARRVYDEMAKEMISEITSGRWATAKIVLEKAIRLRQVTSGFIKDESGTEVDLHTAKLDALLNLITDATEQDEKLVVFCVFKHDYHSISAALDTRGYSYRSLTGETRERDRATGIRDFQTLPSVPVFISQIQSGSLGIDLSAARLACFYSLDYNYVTYVQAQDRILDVRRPRPLGIYHLLCPKTIDVPTLNVLRKRGNLAKSIIHSPRRLLTNDWPVA